MQHTKTIAVAVVTAAVLLGGIGEATAGGQDPVPGTSADRAGDGDGAHALCRRAARIDKRIDTSLTRLSGAASVRGSLARLQHRIDAARAAGHSEVEAFLSDRLAGRKSHVTALRKQREDLAKVVEWCKAEGGSGAPR